MLVTQPSGEKSARLRRGQSFEGRWCYQDGRQGGTLAMGVEAAFHLLRAIERNSPMGDTKHGRGGTADLARDPARLGEEIGQTINRGKLGSGLGEDPHLRQGVAGRHCQYRLEECQFRQSKSWARRRIFSMSETFRLQSAKGSRT